MVSLATGDWTQRPAPLLSLVVPGALGGGGRLKVPTLLTASLPNTPLSLLPAVQLAPILWNFTEVIPITIKSGAVEIDLEWIPETQFRNSLLVQWLGGPHFSLLRTRVQYLVGEPRSLKSCGAAKTKTTATKPKTQFTCILWSYFESCWTKAAPKALIS